ncbi:MAG: hypothetical protein WA252_00020 [Candidatus Sulfotelmatobacter sp.]
MIAAIRSLRQSVDTLIDVVTHTRGRDVSPADSAARVEETFLSWANLRPELQNAGIDTGILERLDKLFTSLIRLTTSASPRRSYLAQLRAIKEVAATGLTDFGTKAALLPHHPAPQASSPMVPEISDLPNELVPRFLFGWLAEIRKFLVQFPFENNVFIMIAYRKKLEPLVVAMREEIERHDLNPVVAKDNGLTDDLYNPIANLLCCKYGIAVFDRGETGQKHNANVVYELAVMQTLRRPCVIMKHNDVTSMPSDFLHKLYRSYRTTGDATTGIREWLASVKPDTV